MRSLVALIVIVLGALPALYAGLPGLAPGWFDQRYMGVPMSVLAMSALMVIFVILAAVCSSAARGQRLHGEEVE